MDAFGRLGINWWGVALYMVNFGVVLWLMAKFVYKPLVKAIDERRDDIRKNLEEAEALRVDFAAREERVKAEAAAALTAVKEEAKRLSEKAQADAAAVVAEAEARKGAMLAEAEARVRAMEAEIMQRVEKEAVSRVATAVERILRHGVDQKMVEESVRAVWSKNV